MPNALKNRSKWFELAQEHNGSAEFDAIRLNGSQSYTLAAIHLAAGLPIPKSFVLDTKRAHGKFVADHFTGLRQLYETGVSSSRWLHSIIKQTREFALQHRINGDQLIQKIIELTERNGHKSASCRLIQSTSAACDQSLMIKELGYPNDDITI